MAIIGDKRTQRAWAFYDWANSVYNLVIGTAIFPIFFSAVAVTIAPITGESSDQVYFFGHQITNTTLYSYTIAASFIVVIFLSPLLAGIADYGGKKKTFLSLFCYLGSLACISLYWFDAEHLELSMLSVFFASLGFWNSIVFYNSYLPEIAEPEEHDKLSARGFAMGYIGSVILLLICFGIIIGVGEHLTRWSFVLVGLWWLGFAQITLRRLPANPHKRKPDGNLVTYGFAELKSVYRRIRETFRLQRYLWAFLLLSMAVQTIMLMAQFFGIKEVYRIDEATGQLIRGMDTNQLIIAIILVQIIAIPGSFFFSFLSGKIGNVKTLIFAVIAWISVCLTAFFFVDRPLGFFLTASCIGFVMGGTQALTRSTYSKFLPKTKDTASFFSFYDVAEKIGIVIGMVTFGYIEDITGSIRNSILALVVFFVVALVLLIRVPKLEKSPDAL